MSEPLINKKEKSIYLKAENKRALTIAILVVFLFASLYLVSQPNFPRKTISVTQNAFEMGTFVSMSLYARDKQGGEQAVKNYLSQEADRLLSLVDDLDQNVLSWRSENSEVFRINHFYDAKPFPLSNELAEVIRTSLEISKESAGAMDITLRPVIDLWGIESYDGKTDYVPPSEENISQLADRIGYTLVSISGNENECSLLKNNPLVNLDLGAVGKGYALDLISENLTRSEIDGAIAAVGGSILTYGYKDGSSWQIGIRDPKGTSGEYVGILAVPGKDEEKNFISTSGGYEKYVEYDGQILEHIIDGRTLHPAESDLYSVTVITKESGLVSDGLSTACYLLGMELSAPLLEAHQAEAVFITKDNKIYRTDGVADSFKLTNPDYSLGDKQ